MTFDKDYCGGTILFRIDKGNSDSTDLKGLDVVVAVDFPGPTLLDGNDTARVLIDERANPTNKKYSKISFREERASLWR